MTDEQYAQSWRKWMRDHKKLKGGRQMSKVTVTILHQSKSAFIYDIKGFEVKGHTDERVCHGLSAITYFAAIGAAEVAKRKDTHFSPEPGDTKFLIDGDLDEISKAIMDTFKLTVQEMDEHYPGTIEIIYKNIEPV